VESRAREVEAARVQALVLAARRDARGAEDEEAAARESERERARAGMLDLTSGVEELGTTLSFTWWAQQGALTLLDYREERGGGRAGPPVGREELARVLRLVLAEYASRPTGEVVLTLRREETRWAVDYRASPAASPPAEVKTLPVRGPGNPAHTFLALHEAAKRWLRTVQVPTGGAVEAEMQVHLEDGRLTGWELRESRRTLEGRGGAPRSLSPEASGAVTRVLLPFTEGLGPRTVRLTLRAEHRVEEVEARGRVVLARVERPPPAPELSWYRALHESILLRWRESVHEGSAWLAQKGVEELALWYAGGIIAHGTGFFAIQGLSVVTRALKREPAAAAGWLRTTLVRLRSEDRRAFEQLWRKVQLEGEQALTRGERETLRGLMESIEQLVRTPLATHQKDFLRGEARKYYKQLHPEFAALMDSNPRVYPVHHRHPLEFAHCFPAEDINAAENLILVQVPVHSRINAIWTKFRGQAGNATAGDIDQVARIIDKHFEARWYNRTDLPESEIPLLDDAREAALKELRQLFPGMR
jgi:hypothetical protein